VEMGAAKMIISTRSDLHTCIQLWDPRTL